MTIYPKHNRLGNPTGSYLVEVTRNGKRTRMTVRGLEEAKEAEQFLLARYVPPDTVRPPAAFSGAPRGHLPYTVGRLSRDARVIWRGTKDEAQSSQRFLAVCDILGTDTPLAEVRTGALDAVVETLTARGLLPRTVHRYLAAFSAALRWALERDHIIGMPVIPWPDQGRPKVRTPISRDDEAAMLERLAKSGSPDVHLIANVLLATGARIGEILALEPADIDEANEVVTFRDTKNGDDRQVPLEAALCGRLRALALVGMPTYRRISLAFHKARKRAGIAEPVTPHVMRHTVATRLSDASVSVPTIGRMLGHRSTRTTEGYIHPEREAIKSASKVLRRGNLGAEGVINGGDKGQKQAGTRRGPSRFD